MQLPEIIPIVRNIVFDLKSTTRNSLQGFRDMLKSSV